MKRFAFVAGFVLSVLLPAVGRADTYTWTAIAPGGGGRFVVSAISPSDSTLLLSACDMGGAYRTTTAGYSWTMMPFTSIDRVNLAPYNAPSGFLFHPTIPTRVYAASIGNGWMRSDDRGLTWAAVPGSWTGTGWNYGISPGAMAFDRKTPANGIALFNSTTPATVGAAAFVTTSSGTSWSQVASLPADGGDLVNVVFDGTTTPSAIVAATEAAVYRSLNNGTSWTKVGTGLGLAGTTLQILDFAGGGNSTSTRLYATTPTQVSGTTLNGGVYVSIDGGLNWSAAPKTGITPDLTVPTEFTALAVCAASPLVVYAAADKISDAASTATDHSMVYRSADGGTTWSPVLHLLPADPDYNVSNTSWLDGQWGWSYPVESLAVSASDSDIVMATNITGAYLSSDGGASWKQVHAGTGSATAQPAGRMQAMSFWNYYFAPSNHSLQYAAATDFAGWKTADGATTWQFCPSTTWNQNTYALAVDPTVAGKVWAAASTTHDVPMWSEQSGMGTYAGGILFSTDSGATWTKGSTNGGLASHAVNDLWLDPTSSSTSRTLWAAIPGYGAYKSTSGGSAWTAFNSGIATTNLNVLRVGGDGLGTVYAMTTIKGSLPGALYKSTNGGTSWTSIFSKTANPFLTTFTIDPNSASTLYVCALQTTTASDAGGVLYKSTNGGSTWTAIYSHPTYAVAVDPSDSTHLIASSWTGLGHGLVTSHDGGSTWSVIAGYPFWRPLKIVFDPTGSNTVIITNWGGGIYRGVLQ